MSASDFALHSAIFPNDPVMPVQHRFHEGHLTVAEARPQAAAIVQTGTPLLDVALMMEQSEFRYVLVQDERNAIVGIVSNADLTRNMTAVTHEISDDWKSRPIEDLMVTRLSDAPASLIPVGAAEVSAGSSISCIPIIEEGRITGVMTPDDILVSWTRLEPALRAAGMDDVTQLANRSMFMRRLAEEWARAARSREPLALFLFDVDYFKQVNDQCGHLAGDAVLAAIGKSLQDSLRSYDVVARIGGDEFAALCFNCSEDSIGNLIRRIQEAVQDIVPPEGLQRGRLTLSIGAAVVQSSYDTLTTEDLFSNADACLYRSKAEGRDRAYRIVLDDSGQTAPECVVHPGYSEGSVDYLSHEQHLPPRGLDATQNCRTTFGTT
ncbi:MAG: diguanylate cyclase [Planctomycetota bacterium]|nr:diguanylate cyclase [Planctomycetota bacterium]